MVGKVADGACQAGLAVANQAQGVAGIETESGVERGVAEPPAGAGRGRTRGFEQQYRFQLAAGLVEDRQHGGVAAGLYRLRMRAGRHAKGEQQG